MHLYVACSVKEDIVDWFLAFSSIKRKFCCFFIDVEKSNVDGTRTESVRLCCISRGSVALARTNQLKYAQLSSSSGAKAQLRLLA